FGPPSAAGFGSAVFFETHLAAGGLEAVALASYRRFVGAHWTEANEEAWMGRWKRILERAHGGAHDIVGELRNLADVESRSSAERLLDGIDDPSAAHAALVRAMDEPAVAELAIYRTGDGEALSGILVAARRNNGEGISLVFLMD
ncbi:MAG: hypothetical protein QG573_2425, partial [Acidobacteriota bacterium]|nr:hypothetical protein [Acidobacteriota bacterium]